MHGVHAVVNTTDWVSVLMVAVRVLKTSYRSMITNAAVVSFRCRFMTQHVESERYSETEEDRERDARTHTHTHIHVYGHTDAQKGARAHWHNVMCLDTWHTHAAPIAALTRGVLLNGCSRCRDAQRRDWYTSSCGQDMWHMGMSPSNASCYTCGWLCGSALDHHLFLRTDYKFWVGHTTQSLFFPLPPFLPVSLCVYVYVCVCGLKFVAGHEGQRHCSTTYWLWMSHSHVTHMKRSCHTQNESFHTRWTARLHALYECLNVKNMNDACKTYSRVMPRKTNRFTSRFAC